jgi:hypothetical protein
MKDTDKLLDLMVKSIDDEIERMKDVEEPATPAKKKNN